MISILINDILTSIRGGKARPYKHSFLYTGIAFTGLFIQTQVIPLPLPLSTLTVKQIICASLVENTCQIKVTTHVITALCDMYQTFNTKHLCQFSRR